VNEKAKKFDIINCKFCEESLGKLMRSPDIDLFYNHLSERSCKLSCQNGHIGLIHLQNENFEIQFQLGARALIDGYYAESVFNFTKALERFYEFCIKIFLLEDKLPNDFEAAWDLVRNQSERQLGAFIFLYLKCFNESTEILKDFKINRKNGQEFRNKVIHKGYLPSKKEATSYGEFIFNNIIKIITKLKQKYNAKIFQIGIIDQVKLKDNNKDISDVSNLWIGTVLSLAREDIDRINFEDELKKLGEKRNS